MSDSLVSAAGEPVEIFCYPNATWFLNFCAKPNAKSSDGTRDTTGDWGLVEGPSFFFNGGTFIGVNAQSKNYEAAKKVFEYLMLNEDYLKAYCSDTGDYPAAAKVAEELTPTIQSPMLDGQNHYLTFNKIAGNIREMYTDKYFDETVWGFMQDQAQEYAAGNKDMETALKDYQASLMGQYPGLNPAA
jgi:maltose-binding protein MalE